MMYFSVSACGTVERCNARTCDGCCDEAGECQRGDTASACGFSGQACAVCGGFEQCVFMACRSGTSVPVGGAGGGATGGGGGGSGGGAGTGGGAATGGGSGEFDCSGPYPAGSTAANSQAWKNDILVAHNFARACFGTPKPSPALEPMTWNAEAEAHAVWWAAECVWEHSMTDGWGENLYAITGGTPPAHDPVESWMTEEAFYAYAFMACESGEMCGHYTQVMWRDTNSVGCAQHVCSTGSPFGGGSWVNVVCNYAPPGNWVGQRPY